MLAGLLTLAIALIVLITLVGQLAMQGAERIRPEFFVSFPSFVPEDSGIFAAWVGTTLVIFITALVAVPLGIAAGVYLEEYAWKSFWLDLIEVNITNLAGVPSIVYGLLALGLFVYELGLGDSIITGGLTLALLVLPIVVVTTREAIRAIPQTIREAAYALGATKWQTVWDHVLPYSLGSILTGVIIALSRAIGETAPLVTIGALMFVDFLPESPFTSEFPFISFDWLRSPFTVMPIQMYNWVGLPQPEYQVNAAAAGTVLLAMTLAMNALAIALRYYFRRGIKW